MSVSSQTGCGQSDLGLDLLFKFLMPDVSGISGINVGCTSTLPDAAYRTGLQNML